MSKSGSAKTIREQSSIAGFRRAVVLFVATSGCDIQELR